MTLTPKIKLGSTRIRPPRRAPSALDTRYMNMLLALDGIPRYHNILIAFFTWLLLAGFVLFPGTFSNFRNAESGTENETEKEILHSISNLPLFVIAFICCGVGALGMVFFWWKWMLNYVWLTNRIFLPGFLHSLAGIVSTLVNLFGVQHGVLSESSKITLIVTCAAAGVTGSLFIFYNFFMLRKVKEQHDRQVGREIAGTHGEGIGEVIKKMEKEKEPEAGMV